MKKLFTLILILAYSLGFSQGASEKTLKELKDAVKTNSVIGGVSTRISVTPTISASPDYSSGDNVGGIQSIPLAVRTSSGTATLFQLDIWDKAAQNSAFIIDFWDASPSGTYTDNAAEVIAGDDGKYLGSVYVSSADWVTTGAVSRCSIKGIGLLVKPSTGTTVYATVLTTSVPNQASTSDLIFKYSFIQD